MNKKQLNHLHNSAAAIILLFILTVSLGVSTFHATGSPAMNTQAEILARLLQLFPVQKIKERWQIKGKKEEISLDIAKKSKPDEIKHFAKENAGLTKQCIYVRTHGISPLSKLPKTVLPNAELISSESTASNAEHFYLLDLTYNAVLREPELEEVELHFKWPVRIVFEKDYFLVHITLMEKNVASYFPEERKALSAGKDLSEEDIIGQICKTLGIDLFASAYDLNKGIKALWEADLFDSLNVRWKEPKDTTTKTMDKDCLLKRDNPQAYKILSNPRF